MRQIREYPLDDGPRAVFADWLEEQGEADRAEFIRVQLELHGKKLARPCKKCGGSGGEDKGFDHCSRCDGKGFVGSIATWKLQCREKELLEGWVQGRDGSNCKWWLEEMGGLASARTEGDWHGFLHIDNVYAAAKFERGFVGKVGLTIKNFLDTCNTVFGMHPITEVEINDRKPNREIWHAVGFSWMPIPEGYSPEIGLRGLALDGIDQWTLDSEPYVLPSSLWDMIMGLRLKNVVESDDDCLEWLSNGCVSYGRDKAGLRGINWKTRR